MRKVEHPRGITRRTKQRQAALFGVLAASLVVTLIAHYDQIERQIRLLHPVKTFRCDGDAPVWLPEIASWARAHGMPGMQLHIRQGSDTFNCSLGEALTARGDRREMSSAAPLLYASLTKIFTSTLVMLQVEQGAFSLDDHIYELLQLDVHDLRQTERWRTITVRDLLQHRAGFAGTAAGDPMSWPEPPCPANFELLQRVTVHFQPGTRFAYSNLGYCLLGVVLERTSGQDFTDLLAQRILTPLGMDSVRVVDGDGLVALDIGLKFANGREQQSFIDRNWLARAATGGAAGSARDLGMFLYRLSEPSSDFGSVGRELLRPLPGCDDAAWRSCHGLVFYSHKEVNGVRMYWRDGSVPGATALAAVTSRGDVLVALANTRDSDWMPAHDELGKIVYRLMATGQPSSTRVTKGNP